MSSCVGSYSCDKDREKKERHKKMFPEYFRNNKLFKLFMGINSRLKFAFTSILLKIIAGQFVGTTQKNRKKNGQWLWCMLTMKSAMDRPQF